uniref:Uncharacterized protein n=1 Tax=Rhizophora mucronata TaxID=61149 RepID=A0A2P2NP46_RHIMU
MASHWCSGLVVTVTRTCTYLTP